MDSWNDYPVVEETSAANPWDKYPVAEEGEKGSNPWDKYPVAGEETPPKSQPFFSVSDTWNALGDVVGGVAQIPASIRAGMAGFKNPRLYTPEEVAANEERTKFNQGVAQRQTEREAQGESSSVGNALRGAAHSAPFTLTNMAVMGATELAARAVGAGVGALAGPEAIPVGSQVGSTVAKALKFGAVTGAGYAAANASAGQQFLNDTLQEIKARYKQQTGKEMSESEQDEAYKEVLPLAEEYGKAEAGPETVGNLAQLWGGKYLFGLGKHAVEGIAKRIGAFGVGQLTEHGGETYTGSEQHNLGERKNALIESRAVNPDNLRTGLPGYAASFQEQAPTTLALSALGLGAGAAYKGIKSAVTPTTPQQPETSVGATPTGEPVPVQVNGQTIAHIPPGSTLTPEDVAMYAAEPGGADTLKAMARKGYIILPEVVAPVPGVDRAITQKMNDNIAAGAVLAPKTFEEVEREKQSQAAFNERLRQQEEASKAEEVRLEQMRAQEEQAAARDAEARRQAFERLKKDQQAATAEVVTSAEDASGLSPQEVLAQLGAISESNDSRVMGLAVENGTFASGQTLHIEDGHVVLRRFADGPQHLIKEGQTSSGPQDLVETSLHNSGGNGVPTVSAAANAGVPANGYSQYDTEGTFRIPVQDFLSLARAGEITLGNIGETEVVISPAVAKKYLSESRSRKPSTNEAPQGIPDERVAAAFEAPPQVSPVTTDLEEYHSLAEKRGQAQNKVKGVTFSKKEETRFQELATTLRPHLRETVDPIYDPVVGEDINGQPIRRSVKGTFYTVENGRVRTGPAFKEKAPLTDVENWTPSTAEIQPTQTNATGTKTVEEGVRAEPAPGNQSREVESPESRDSVLRAEEERREEVENWAPQINLPATASINGHVVVGTVGAPLPAGKVNFHYNWNGKPQVAVVRSNQLSRPVTALSEAPRYIYTQEQNSRKAGKHIPVTPGVHENFNFQQAFASMAEDKSLSRIYREIARILSKLPSFANMDLHIVADGRKGYAGEYSHTKGRSAIAINLRQVARGKVDALGTLLHEALHHVTLAKIRDPQGDVELEAAHVLNTIRLKLAKEPGAQRFGYELKTNEEFITGVLTHPGFQDWLAGLPASVAPGEHAGKFRSLLSEIFRRIAELATGKHVAPGSTLDQSMASILALFETPYRTLELGPLQKLSAKSLAENGVTPEQDAEYMQAVKDGDVAKQQAMVDAAAKAAEYGVKGYHGTNANAYSDSDFTVFHTRGERGASFFSSRPEEAGNYGEKVYNVALALSNPLIIDAKGKSWVDLNDAEVLSKPTEALEQKRQSFAGEASKILKMLGIEVDEASPLRPIKTVEDLSASGSDTDALAKFARKYGYDGAVFKNVKDSPTAGMYKNDPQDTYAVFNPNQIKSADPITRDAEGNVIPLSQRFNNQSNSTLYSLPDDAEFKPPPGFAFTRARFAPTKPEQQTIKIEGDESATKKAFDWINAVGPLQAADLILTNRTPGWMTGNEQTIAVSGLIAGLANVTIDPASTEDEQTVARATAQQLGVKWKDLGAEAAREMRQRGVQNGETLQPMASVLAAEEVLADRGKKVLEKQFDGGEEGAATRTAGAAEKATAEADERLENIISRLMGSMSPKLTAQGALAKMFRGKGQLDQIIEEVGKALQLKARGTLVTPERKTALANLVSSLKNTLSASVKGAKIPAPQRTMQDLLTSAFVNQVSEGATFEEAWKAGRQKVLDMLIDMELDKQYHPAEARLKDLRAKLTHLEAGSEEQQKTSAAERAQLATQIADTKAQMNIAMAAVTAMTPQFEAQRDKLMPSAPTVAFDPVASREAISRAFEQAGYTAELATGLDKSGKRALSIKDALLNRKRATDAVMKQFDEAMAAKDATTQHDWPQARALAERAVKETLDSWQKQIDEDKATKLQATKDNLLGEDSKALEKLVNSVRGKIAPDEDWSDILHDLPRKQDERLAAIKDRVAKHEALKNLTPDEATKLAENIDKLWQRERLKAFQDELLKAGVLKAKSTKAAVNVASTAPELLRLMNLGVFNSSTFREAVSKRFGIKMMSNTQAQALRKLAAEAWEQPQGVLRNRKLKELLTGIQHVTGSSWSEVVSSYWIASVLSGLNTQFNTWGAVLNGAATNLIQAGALLARGNGAAALATHQQWWKALNEGMKESLHILWTGDTTFTKRFEQDIHNALDGEKGAHPIAIGERMWKEGTVLQKVPGALMMMVGRSMVAADHINNVATTQGAMAVARAMNPELYDGKTSWTQKEIDDARRQAVNETTGGADPTTAEERLDVGVRTREILNSGLSQEHREQASLVGDQAAFQNDPTGLFGGIYRWVKQGLGSAVRDLDERAQDEEANRITRAICAVGAGSVYAATGTRFMRYGFNLGNEFIRYMPGSWVLNKIVPILGRNLSPMQQELLIGKNLVGAIGLASLYAMFGGDDEDKDGVWHLEGPWDALSPDEKNERRTAGKAPNTMWKREKGQIQRIGYGQWALAGLIGAAGSMLDEKRYEPAKWKERNVAGHMLRGAVTGLYQLQNVAALENLAKIMGGSPSNAQDKIQGPVERLAEMGTAYAGGFAPTFLKDLDKWDDPRNFKANGAWEKLVREVPVARRFVNDGRPQFNRLGQDVRVHREPYSRLYTADQVDKATEYYGHLLSRGLDFPSPSADRKVIKGGKKVPMETLGKGVVYDFEKAVAVQYDKYLTEHGEELLKLPTKAADKVMTTKARHIMEVETHKVQAKVNHP